MTESEENPHLPANHVEIDLPTGLPKLSIERLPDSEEERPARKSVTFLDSIMETKSPNTATPSHKNECAHQEIRHTVSSPDCRPTNPSVPIKPLPLKQRSSSVFIKLHRTATTPQRLSHLTETMTGSSDTGIHTAPVTSDSDSQFSFPERPLGSPTPSKLSSMSSVDMGAGNEDLVQVASPSHKRLVNTGRRSSFLYQNDALGDDSPPLKLSRTSSIHSHVEETYVTPFPKILANMHKVRENFIYLMGLPDDTRSNAYYPLTPTPAKRPAHAHARDRKFSLDGTRMLAQATLEQIDWCLQQLESVGSAKAMGGAMAQDKFRRLLTKELSNMSERSKSGHQLAEWVQGITGSRNERNEQVDRALSHSMAHSDTALDSKLSQSLGHDVWRKQAMQSSGSKVSVKVQDYCERVPTFGVSDPKMNVSKMTQFMVTEMDKWSVDVFYLNQISASNPLICSAYNIFKRRRLFNTFRISPPTFINFIASIQKEYRDNPYHNRIHAADVLLATHYLLSAKPLENVFSELEVFAALIAAAVHDVDHPGKNNQFLIETGHELAILYNDNSVLENHHLAMAFRIMQDPSCNVLENVDTQQKKAFRGMVVDMVLATDMSVHFKHLAELKNLLETKKVANDGILELDNYNDRSELLQCLIHCADLSNQGKEESLATSWSHKIMEESFLQGDEEKKRGIPMNPMGNRKQVSIEKCQVTFIDLIVYPLFETWAELVYPEAQHILDNLNSNREYWSSRIPISPPDSSSPSSPSSPPGDSSSSTHTAANSTSRGGHSDSTIQGRATGIDGIMEEEEEEEESSDIISPGAAEERRLSFRTAKNSAMGQEVHEWDR